MMGSKHNRILAIDLASRGFGFAVLEDGTNLVDWGFKEVRRDKSAGTLKRIGRLMDSYSPNLIVLQDYFETESRRNNRVQQLSLRIGELAAERGIKTRWIPRKEIQKKFRASGAETKQEIAVEIAKRFPELQRILPKPRRAWDTEDPRINVFDAVGLYMTISSMKP